MEVSMKGWVAAIIIGGMVLTAAMAVQAAPRQGQGTLPHQTPSGSSEHHRVRLHFAIRFGADPRIDIAPAGPSLGDVHVLDDFLLREGKQVGHTGGTCTLTDLDRPEEACTMTFSLPRGILTGQWLNTPPVHKLVAVTGGTGIYRNARGVARVVEFSSERGAVTFLLEGVPARR
jgi:hypothetical protein